MTFRNILIFILVPLCLAFALQSLGDFGSRDSIAYWSAVQAFLNREDPYNLDTLLRIQRLVDPSRESPQLFLNPPWALPLLIPLFFWNFSASTILLLSINISVTFFTLRRLGVLLTPLPARYATLVGGFFPILSCWYFGQLSCFLLLGSVLALEWITKAYSPWWKVAVALALWSIKPQTPYLLILVTLAAILRYTPKRELAKIGLLAAVPASFLVYRDDLLVGWISTFVHASKWATCALPSLASAALSSVNRPGLIAVPAEIIAATVLVLEKGAITPYRFLCYLIISSLTAPYAWIFDFSSFVIVIYVISVIIIRDSTNSWRWCAHVAILAALCLPFEALFTNNLHTYAVHPLLVAALFFVNRREVRDLFEKKIIRSVPLLRESST